MPPKPQTVDEYLARLSRDKRSALEQLRRAIRAAAPKAEECISYQMPAFRLDGRMLVWFGAATNHCAFYPGAAPIQALKDQLEPYDASKGTIRFPPDRPLPAALVRKLVKARIAERAVTRRPPLLTSRPIIAFVATTNPKRAKAFYAKTLGLRLLSEDGFALVFDAGGTMLRVATVETLQPAGYTVLGWIVPDIAKTVRDLIARGVMFQRYDGMRQDDLGVWSSPGGARVAWFSDPDGNTLSLTELERPARRNAGQR